MSKIAIILLLFLGKGQHSLAMPSAGLNVQVSALDSIPLLRFPNAEGAMGATASGAVIVNESVRFL